MFQTIENLEKWIAKKPDDWARVIAVRAALRIFPLIESRYSSVEASFVLAVFRVNFANLIVAHEASIERLENFLSSASAFLSGRSANIPSGHRFFTARASAADAAASAINSPIDAIAAASVAASARAQEARVSIWSEISFDARWLEENGEPARYLFQLPLWQAEGGAPGWFIRAWERLKNLPMIQENRFAPWIEWYERLVPLGLHRDPINIFDLGVSRRIVSQSHAWWERGVKEVNADIVRWLEEERGVDLPEQVEQALSNLPLEEPTAHIYTPENGRVVARPIFADPTDPDGAQVYLAELRDKATALAADLSRRHNYFDNDWIIDAVTKLRDYLWEGAEPRLLARLNPHLLHSRLRPVKEIADGYQLPPDVEAVYPEFKPRIRDVAKAGEDLELCLPRLRQLEAERIARALPEDPAGQEATRQHLADFVTAIQAVDPVVVDDSAKTALETEKALANDEPASPTERRNRLAALALTVRNFCRPAGRVAGDVAIWTARHVRDGVGEGIRAIIKVATVTLVVAVMTHATGLAAIPGFDKVAQIFGYIKKALEITTVL